MTELLTAAQMKAIEAAAIASGAVTGLELMERAGRGVVEAVFEEWPELAQGPHRAVVLCGPGGNGGDGFVVARLLKQAGWAVEVFLYGEPDRMPPDARVNYERWLGMGEVSALTIENFPRLHDVHTDLFVDALFGIGQKRQVEGEAAVVLTHIRCAIWPYERSLRQPERLVSIDVPTGLCSDSGVVLAGSSSGLAHFRADMTVSFHRPRTGHFLADGPELSGKLVVKDIGLSEPGPPPEPRGPAMPKAYLVGRCTFDLGKDFGHKFSHGHALILSGGVGHGGAARLAARGSLRIGAGLVTVGCPPAALIENAAHLNAIMLKRMPDADALAKVLADARITALCLGPGMGTGPREAALLAVALGSSPPAAPVPPPPAPPHEGEGSRVGQAAAPANPSLPLPPVGRGEGWGARRPTVLDADALTLLAQNPALFAALHKDCILTPHAGEFARLFPDIAAKLAEPATRGPAYSKVDATRDAAKRAGCVVLFKGPDTVIADPSGRCSINSAHYDRAAPWLATAGSGDVLAGFITGLLARGFAPMQAAETAAWLHVECARSFGPGLIAEDLPEELPKVFRALGL
ncbi:MAG: NAD(P)H-hydrate epimerase [Pseudomonadota bacterium]